MKHLNKIYRLYNRTGAMFLVLLVLVGGLLFGLFGPVPSNNTNFSADSRLDERVSTANGIGANIQETNCTVAAGELGIEAQEQQMIDKINAFRQQKGLSTLIPSQNLQRASAWFAKHMGDNRVANPPSGYKTDTPDGKGAHTDSLGRYIFQRISDCGYPGQSNENITYAGGQNIDVNYAFQGWVNSEGHNRTMSDPSLVMLGVSKYSVSDPTYGKMTYWVADFGKSDDGTRAGSGGGGGSGTGCGVPANAGQCGGGNIMDWQTGAPICQDYTGNGGEGVCGADGWNYVCNGSNGVWDRQTTHCGPGSGGGGRFTGPNGMLAELLSCGNHVWKIKFSWDRNQMGIPAGVNTDVTYVDLKFDDNIGGWQNPDGSNNYVSTEALPGNASSYTWDGIQENHYHKWRANTHGSNDQWYGFQNEASFSLPVCPPNGYTPPGGGGGPNPTQPPGGAQTCDQLYQAHGYASYAAACQSIGESACVSGSSTTGACRCTPYCSGNPQPTNQVNNTPVPTSNPTRVPTNVPTNTQQPTTVPQATPTPQPTAAVNPTSTPNPTPSLKKEKLNIAVNVPAIGSDTQNGENPNPVRNKQKGSITIVNSRVPQDRIDRNVEFSFNPSNYTFTYDAGEISDGIYNVEAKFDNSLWLDLGNVTLEAGSSANTKSVGPKSLTLGDLNQDNRLDLSDYNLFISCYGDRACSYKVQADVNMDGKVDEKDLNIFYSGLANRKGD